jgi:hypothetical protein
MEHRNMNHLLVAAVMIAGVIASAQRPANAPNYDPSKEITIQGTVEDVLTAQTGNMPGVHLTVKAENKNYDVRLGPAWYVQEKQFTFAKGDKISVIGSPLAAQPGSAAEVMIARQVKKGDSVLELRNASGFPNWSRGPRRRTK